MRADKRVGLGHSATVIGQAGSCFLQSVLTLDVDQAEVQRKTSARGLSKVPGCRASQDRAQHAGA